MLILIDKSGCSGFKFSKGSTAYLVIGMVIFSDSSEAEKVSNAIQSLKTTLNMNSEFKFNKSSDKFKELFLDTICQYDFEIRALIADKVGITDPNLINNTDQFYDSLITSLIQYNETVLSNASLKINSSIDRKFRHAIKKHLDVQLNQQTLKKYKFSHPKTDSLIQLTDMLIGTIANNYTNESVLSYHLLNKLVESKKIKSIWKLRE